MAWFGQKHHSTGVPMLGIVQGVPEEDNDDLWCDG
jgi:hypothetical protein